MHIDDETLYKDDSTIIYNTPELVGFFFPIDAKSVSIFIKTDEGLSKVKSDSLAQNIEKAFKKYASATLCLMKKGNFPDLLSQESFTEAISELFKIQKRK